MLVLLAVGLLVLFLLAVWGLSLVQLLGWGVKLAPISLAVPVGVGFLVLFWVALLQMFLG
jgi:hypothetical protein